MHKTKIFKMNSQIIPGINATLDELIRARPPKGMTGFAPAGRVSTHQWGSNASVFKGRGMEFAESRIYQPGDDVRNMDWRVTARTGKAHSKLFQEERERPVHILLDLRAMMHFGTRVRFKSHLAAEVAAQLAWAAHDGGDRLGGQLLTRSGLLECRAARTRRAVLRFLEHIVMQTAPQPPMPSAGTATSEVTLSRAILRLRRICRPGTLVFIISDFHDFDGEVSQELGRLCRHAHVTLIQILDILDRALPARGGRVSDGENSVALAALGRAALDDYSLTFTRRQQRLQKTCGQKGIAYHQLDTTDSARSILQAPKYGNKPQGVA